MNSNNCQPRLRDGQSFGDRDADFEDLVQREGAFAEICSEPSVLDHAQRDAGRIRGGMVHLVVRYHTLRFVEVVPARVQVAVVEREVAA